MEQPSRSEHRDPVRVLYLHAVGAFGGASRSLVELLRALPAGAVRAHVVAPRGSVIRYFEQAGAAVYSCVGLSQFDTTRYSYYRGVRWVVLLREFALALPTLRAMRAAREKWPAIDIIHCNEIMVVLVGVLARRLFRARLVVHVRSVMETRRAPLRRAFIRWVLRRFADRVIAIDETVCASIPPKVGATVIHNGLFDCGPSRVGTSAAAGTKNGSLRIGFVGNLLLVKGILDLVEAARLIKQRNVDARFVIVGDAARPNKGIKGWVLERLGLQQDVKDRVLASIERYGLAEHFEMRGFMDDLQAVYSQMDVLCFPSHYNAVGRPVFEAGFFGVPSIVAISDPLPDTIVHEVTGLCVPEKDPPALASAIERMSRDREMTARMGAAAREHAYHHFDMRRNALELLNIYHDLLRPPVRPSTGSRDMSHTASSTPGSSTQ